MTRVAAVDCGTNTVKLLVADLDPVTGESRELLREARMVRLGQGVDRTGRLSDAALQRLFAALEEYAALVEPLRVERLRFCATSAVRDASNADVFARGVQARLGVRPEVVSGAEEAALSYAGATRGLGEVPGPILVVDIGGGSTELVLGEGHGEVRAAHSLDIGSVRLTERLLHSDPPTPAEVDRVVHVIDEALDDLPGHEVHLAAARSLVAVSGTGLTVAAAALGLAGLTRDGIDRREVPVAAVHTAVTRLVELSTAERRALPFMHPGRADVIAAGGLVLDRILRRTTVDHLTTSVSDILDGIAWSVA